MSFESELSITLSKRINQILGPQRPFYAAKKIFIHYRVKKFLEK